MSTPQDRFVWRDDEVVVAQCNNCRRNRGNLSCDAFPNGIPLNILRNDFDHRNPYSGDNDLQYSPLDVSIPHPMDKK